MRFLVYRAGYLHRSVPSWPSAIDAAFILGGGCNDYCGEEGLPDGNRSFNRLCLLDLDGQPASLQKYMTYLTLVIFLRHLA